jgi:nitrate/TMAO reductase-like tetraheme cytochrome c subunit
MAEEEKQGVAALLVKIRSFFLPPVEASVFRRVLPYGVLGLLTLGFLVTGTYTWEYTNSPAFCGTTCHTMPPEYAAYQISPHARVACVECHIGRGFISTKITRKAGDIRHVTATLFRDYEFPIYANRLRPARETCERCHFPAKFSDDSLRQNVHYLDDENNSRVSIYLAMRTGGGSEREGLGRGIHWHIENEVWFVPLDELQQDIPYVRVVDSDGEEQTFVALDSPLSEEELAGMEQVRMDCITCHNRISHNILPPDEAVDRALERHQIDSDIPYIRYLAVSVLSEENSTHETAQIAINNLVNYYAEEFPEVYDQYEVEIKQAADVLLAIYDDTVFQVQDVDWETHPNNLGHQDWPGCFRCHDGQHVTESGQAIRLECNLCHSIPQVVDAEVIEPELPLATGREPDSHFSTHWINLHRTTFDQTCQACHDVGNPGGTDNSSFCSNSACHGFTSEAANLDAPGLAAILAADNPVVPEEEPAIAEVGEGGPTFSAQIQPIFGARCTSCHNQTIATGGLVLETYNSTMTGGKDGPVILPGDPEDSPLVQRQREGHFAQLTDDELQLVIDWIDNGAPN